MPIAGAVRFRKWAFSAAQSAHGTPATPAGAFPWRGTPTVNPNWTDLDYDTGSIDPVSLPFRTALDTTATTAGPLDYNSLPIVMNGGVRGGVTPTGGGAAKTWTNQALSLTATTLDEFSAQWGDDYNTDSYRLSDGIVEVIDITFPDNLGPAQISTNWYFGTTNQMVTPVANLTVSSNLPLVFGADTALFIDNAYTGIGGTQISDSLHSAHITITNTIDKKRFMNGSNSRFAVAGLHPRRARDHLGDDLRQVRGHRWPVELGAAQLPQRDGRYPLHQHGLDFDRDHHRRHALLVDAELRR
jgi:hypothetical protein